MQEEQNNLGGAEEKLDGIMNALKVLNEKIEKQGERIERLEIISSQNGVSQASVTSAVSAPPTPPVPENKLTQEWATNVSAKIDAPEEKINFEENIGGTWFARIGITSLVLGVSFLLKYAFDNNWIGETGRVMIGIIIGLILLGLGEKYIRKYFVYGQLITGGGIAVLYLSIFAAFNFYHLIGQLPAFFMMILITAIGIVLSLRYNALSLIIVSIIGGFVTPFLVSNGQNNQIGLLSYVLLLDVAILVISVFRKWRELNFIGFIGTVILFGSWAAEFYTTKDLGMTMFFLTTFFIVYSISSLIYNLVKKEKSSQTEQMLTLFSATAYFGASYALLNDDYHLFMGFFSLILAIYYFLWAYLVKAVTPEDENLYNFLAFLTVGFITLAIPLQFEKNIISIGWLIESIILIYLGVKTRGSEIKILGVAVLVLALLRLMTIDSVYAQDSGMILNQVFLTFIFAVLISYVAAYLFKLISISDGDKNYAQSRQMTVILLVVANFLTIYAISREISFYYQKQTTEIRVKQDKARADARALNSAGSYNKNYYNSIYDDAGTYEEIQRIGNKNSVSLSIFWLMYSIILLAVGIIGKYKGVRVGGLILLSVAILKLFFYDLWSLGTPYRIISSISLGVVLLSISFAYQKYKDKIKEII